MVRLVDAVSPPFIQKPFTARSANPVFVMTTMKPSMIGDEPLHFRVQVFEDEQMQTMISEVSSVDDPGAFEISLDNGATWLPFPPDGLEEEEQGAMLRCKVHVGPRTHVFVRTGVGVETFSEAIMGFVLDEEDEPIGGATVYATDEPEGEPIVSTQTEGDGSYVLYVAPGTYVVVATAEGYADSMQEGIVVDLHEKVLDVNFVLEEVVITADWSWVDGDALRRRSTENVVPALSSSVVQVRKFVGCNSVVKHGGLYFVGDVQALVCVDVEGNEVWSAGYPYSETTVVTVEAVTPDGKVITRQGNRLWCHDASDGSKLWDYVPAHGSGAGLVSGVGYDADLDVVFVQFLTWSHDEYTFTRLDMGGNVDWEVRVRGLPGEFLGNSWGAVVGDKYYVMGGQVLRGIDKSNGSVFWAKNVMNDFPNFAGGSLICGDGDRVYVSVLEMDWNTFEEVGILAAYTLGGVLDWLHPFTDEKSPSCVAVDDVHVFVATGVWWGAPADVVKLNRSTGALVDSYAHTGALSYIAVDPERVYAAGDDILVLDLDTLSVEHQITSIPGNDVVALILATSVSYLSPDRLYRVDPE
jgi:hypothetical protein